MKPFISTLLVLYSVQSALAATNLALTRPSASVKTAARQAIQQVGGPAVAAAKPTWQTFQQPGSFIMALARGSAGSVWVGTEDSGVWRYRGNEEGRPPTRSRGEMKNAEGGAGAWKQFTTADGLGDDYGYAVAMDKQGRIWAGHLNHGVSVFNGKEWRNYPVPFGPIGERVFKIVVCPTDGDVWMGTSAGLTRYSVSKDEWTHFTRKSCPNEEGRMKNEETGNQASYLPTSNSKLLPGLPSDQISAITFDAKGNIYVGTQCDGVAMASREADYQDWRRAPVFTANGLPSRLINDLLAASNGNLYAATSGGLAWSRDGGATWLSRRGKDFADKMRGLAGGPPKGWSAAALPKNPLPEDYVTCLAEDDAGVIWLGFRQRGLLALSDSSYVEQEQQLAQETGGADYVRAILPMADYRPWLGSYGKGLLRATTPLRLQGLELVKNASPVKAAVAAFPTPAKPPTLAQLAAMLGAVKKLEAEKSLPDWKALPVAEAVKEWKPPITYSTNAAYLGEDWRTLGDWTGRYGRQEGKLSAASSPMDHNVGWGWRIFIGPHMGAHYKDGDSLRYWIDHEHVKTDDPRCPYSPVVGCRRIGEWDDHGEVYPMTYAGPDVWVAVGLPEGVFRVALYFCNYNGHGSGEQTRDYLLELKPYVSDPAKWDAQPTLAQCRVHDFWGGVYKNFVVRGPGEYHFKVGRNYSYNTMMNAIFVDRLIGTGFAPSDNSWLPYMEHTRYDPPIVPQADPVQESPELLKARELWASLDGAYAVNAGIAMQGEFRLAAYQAALAANAPPNLLANWRWKMAWWTPAERQTHWETMKAAYDKRTEMVRKHEPF